MSTTHTHVIPIARYLSRPARWRIETPTERRERLRRAERIAAGYRPRVVRLDLRRRSYGHEGPEGAA